jgi:arylsulfatase A-like enzyme
VTSSGVEQAGTEPPREITSMMGGGGKPPIVLYMIDTLRADRLQVGGSGASRIPNFERFAAEAVVFEKAIAQSSWTKASVASLFTGRLPWEHGTQDFEDSLADDIPTLPELVRSAGYRTGGFAANGFISRRFGFDRGFDRFVLVDEVNARAARVLTAASSWLDTLGGSQEVFLYLHTIDPHAPYDPPKELRERWATEVEDSSIGSVEYLATLARSSDEPKLDVIRGLAALYDAEVAYSDHQFGAFLETLHEMGLYERAMIAVLSDHGEEFFEHRSWTHGRTLYSEVISVPLIIRFPGGRGGGTRVSVPVQHVDLLPTVLQLLAIDSPPDLPGRSLLPLALSAALETGDTGPAGTPPIFSRLQYFNGLATSVIAEDWKLILHRPWALDPEPQLFRLRNDPAELHNLASQNPVRVGYLTSLVRRELQLRSRETAVQRIELDRETRLHLKAPGYLN